MQNPFIPKALRIRLDRASAALSAARVAFNNKVTRGTWTQDKEDAVVGVIAELEAMIRYTSETV